MKKYGILFVALFLFSGLTLAQDPIVTKLNPNADPKNEKTEKPPGEEAPPAVETTQPDKPAQPDEPDIAPPDLPDEPDVEPSELPDEPTIEDVEETIPEEKDQPAPPDNPAVAAKRQLIEEGYVVCATHETFGPVYCNTAKDKYVYIDSDGIITPVDKNLVMPTPTDEPAAVKPPDQPSEGQPGDRPVRDRPIIRPDPTKPIEKLPAKTAVSPFSATYDKYLIASYSLTTNGNDNTGKQKPANLTSTRFRNGAAYCAGGDAYSNQVQTPRLTGLNLDAFAISVDFNAETLRRQPILVAGRSCRWLGAEMDAEGNMVLLVNNSDRTPTTAAIRPGAWYNVTVQYKSGAAYLYLDGRRVASKKIALNLSACGNTDTNIGTANYSNAGGFTGFIRNLKVYSFKSRVSLVKPVAVIKADPNLIAHYPLKTDGKEATGKQEAAAITNVIFRNSSARVQGAKGSGGAYANQVQTPRLKGLNLKNFAINLDFWVAQAGAQPIVVAGRSCRWLGAGIDADGMLYLLVNNSDKTLTKVSVQPNAWHSVQLRYQNGTAKLIYDGKQIAAKTAALNLAPCGLTDTQIGTANYANAGGLNGYVRNLKVYSY